MVRRERRHDRHLRVRRGAGPRRHARGRPTSRRSSRSTRAAPTARSAASARSTRAAWCTSSATSSGTSAWSTSTAARPESCRRRRRRCGEEAMANPDYRMYPHVHNVVSMKGQIARPCSRCSSTRTSRRRRRRAQRGECRGGDRGSRPTRDRAGTATRTRPTCSAPRPTGGTSRSPKKLSVHSAPPTSSGRSTRLHDEILRWYDHWLKGIDTGVLDDAAGPLLGERRERVAHGQGLAAAGDEWTKLYLTSWERLRTEPFTPGSADDHIPPDSFVQMPLTQTRDRADASLPQRAAPARPAHRGAVGAQPLGRDRPGGHELDRGAQGRRSDDPR